MKSEQKESSVSRLPDAELDIMLVLWKSHDPLKVSDIHAALQNIRPCSKPAVHTLIERLGTKDFVRIETVDAPTPYKLISPLVKESEYRASESDTFVEKLCRGNWRTLIATLVDTGKISQDDIDDIAELIRQRAECDAEEN